jgi:hypothetical protein
MKTLGQKLLDAARGSIGMIRLTDHDWGSEFYYSDGTYFVRHHKQGFGGMKRRDIRIRAGQLRSLNTLYEIASVLKPTCDLAAGDPMNYTPRNVQLVELTWKVA